MSTPKKQLPEHVATQIATNLPQKGGQGAVDRRTAALPSAPVPTAAPSARTMAFEPYAQPSQNRARAPMPTMMTAPQGGPQPPPPEPVPPPPFKARWVGGPLLSIAVGLLTVWIAGLLGGSAGAPKNLGKLRLSSDPEGATVIVDGKIHPKATPTVIEGEIGATLRVGFKLDGYLDKEADVFVGEGERPFRAKLEKRDVSPPPPTPVVEPPTLEPPPPPATTERVRPKKEQRRERSSAAAVEAAPAPAMTGSGSLSVHVRPWAIVYIDGAKIRQTPLDGHSVGAGLHVVELVNDSLKKREKVTLEVRANGHEEIRRDWDK